MGLIMMRKLIAIIFFLVILCIQGHSVAAQTIGVIMTGDIQYYQNIHKAFLDNANQQGIKMIVQKPMPDPMSWTNSVRKLITLGSDVIIAYGAPATLMAMKLTSDIPIVFAGVYNPKAMNMLGKNATGISATVPVKTMLKNLSSIANKSKLGIVLSKAEKDSILQTKAIKKTESKYGYKSVLFNVSKKTNTDKMKGLDVILLTTCSAGMMNIQKVIEVARINKIPTASLIGGAEDAGVVLTISANPVEQGQKLAGIVKRVIGGAKPSNIPVMHPEKFDLCVNLKAAKAIGVDIPPELLKLATRIIE